MTPQQTVAQSLRLAARDRDPAAAVRAFRAAQEMGVPLTTEARDSLLFLVSGCERWDDGETQGDPEEGAEGERKGAPGGAAAPLAPRPAGPPPPAPAELATPQTALAFARTLFPPELIARIDRGEPATWDDKETAEGAAEGAASGSAPGSSSPPLLVPASPTETALTSLARLSARAGDYEAALRYGAAAASLPSAGSGASAARLRCFVPALVVAARARDFARAQRALDRAWAAGVEPLEPELRLGIRAARGAEGGAGPAPVALEAVEPLFARLGSNHTILEDATINDVQRYFEAIQKSDGPGSGSAPGPAPSASGPPAGSGSPSNSPSLPPSGSPSGSLSSPAGSPSLPSSSPAGSPSSPLGSSPACSAACYPRGFVVVPSATVSPLGTCSACGGRVRAVDLTPSEFADFLAGIGQLAGRMSRAAPHVDGFRRWLEENGPFPVLVDAANVAFYGFSVKGGFSWPQVFSTLDQVRSKVATKVGIWERDFRDQFDRQHGENGAEIGGRGNGAQGAAEAGTAGGAGSGDSPAGPSSSPSRSPPARHKVLCVVNANRLRPPSASAPWVRKRLADMQRRGELFAAPAGTNDDWFWLYAAVAAASDALLVSNDEMRDHSFQLVAPKYFARWKQRHQVRYAIEDGQATFQFPAMYTSCAQKLDNNSWVFPKKDGTWLCIHEPQERAAGRQTEAPHHT